MTVTFKTKSGKLLTGEVVSKGFFDVDSSECYEVFVDGYPHITFRVPISDAQ